MIHKPIQLKDISLLFPHKTCFENFTAQISYGDRIAIIGPNGAGKSTLLKMLQGLVEAGSGEIKVPDDLVLGYVPQIVDEFVDSSGGERLNKALTQALAIDPNVLLLDEPTNHLDLSNRKSLMKMLRSYHGTIIAVSHDVELLRNCIDIIWHIDDGRIHIFSGNYDDYIAAIKSNHKSIEGEISTLHRQKKDTHYSLMKEQMRAAKSKISGEKKIEQRKWPTVRSKTKVARASETSGGKKADIAHRKEELNDKLLGLRLPEIIKPKFNLKASDMGAGQLVSIRDGSLGYGDDMILRNINLSISACERVAVIGDNGSGKSTLIKAILGDPSVVKLGNWYGPKPQDIGYLDQHYGTLLADKSVLETIHDLVPGWTHAEVRRHLNDFLFRKNEEVNAVVSTLSGGEKARLTLAQIAAKTPRLLVLDEVTNNLDLEMRQHMIEVLKEYPGSLIIISHDERFLEEIEVSVIHYVKDGAVAVK